MSSHFCKSLFRCLPHSASEAFSGPFDHCMHLSFPQSSAALLPQQNSYNTGRCNQCTGHTLQAEFCDPDWSWLPKSCEESLFVGANVELLFAKSRSGQRCPKQAFPKTFAFAHLCLWTEILLFHKCGRPSPSVRTPEASAKIILLENLPK